MDKWTRIGPEQVPARTRFNEVPKYEEGLYEIDKKLYAWMVPNGSWGESNAGLLIGEGESLLIDTLWDLKYTRTMLDTMEPLIGTAPIRTVINTHADGDHWWGNQLLPGTEIIASKAACDEMLHIKPISMVLMGKVLGNLFRFLGAGHVGHWFRGMVRPYDYQEVTPTLPTRTFEGTLTLEVGGRDVHLIEVGPAHTKGDILVHVPDARTLFCSDIVFWGSTPVMWAGPIENIFAALHKILEMDVDTIIPGHGPITDKSSVQVVLSYWEYVHKEAKRRYEDGMSTGKAAYDIVLSKEFRESPFADWNSPERMMTNVHMLYRQYKGKKSSPKIPELLNILRKQARLAHKLPDAEPAIMRKS